MGQQPDILRLHDAATGRHYELTIRDLGGSFEARWVVKDGLGQVVVGAPEGVLAAPDADTAFRRAQRIIEDDDNNVTGNDWDFGQPRPAWLDG